MAAQNHIFKSGNVNIDIQPTSAGIVISVGDETANLTVAQTQRLYDQLGAALGDK